MKLVEIYISWLEKTVIGGERDHSFVKEKALLIHLTNRKLQAKHFESSELKSDICHEINEYLMLQIRELIKH